MYLKPKACPWKPQASEKTAQIVPKDRLPWDAAVKFAAILIQSASVVLKTTAIFLYSYIPVSFLNPSIYHVEVIPISCFDRAIFSRDPFLHSDLQLCHWLLLCPSKRHKQEKQTDKPHSLER